MKKTGNEIVKQHNRNC